MAELSNVNTEWGSITTATDEILQCRSGEVLIDTDPVEANRLGLLLFPGQSVAVSSGKTVYYKAAAGAVRVSRVALP